MDCSNDRSSLGQLVDPNVTITPAPKFLSTGGRIELLELDDSWKRKKILSIAEIKVLREKVKEYNKKSKSGDFIFLNELLRGSELNIPCLEIPERNPELEKRLKVLRNKLDEKEYERMTRNVNSTASTKGDPEDSIGQQMKQMNSAMIAVVQYVISLAAAFFFGFSGIQVFMGEMDLAVRLLLGIASAVIVGVAELYILVVLLDDSKPEEYKTEIQGIKKTQ